MSLLTAILVASAAPTAAAPTAAAPPDRCPQVITPDAMICRAIHAQSQSHFAEAAEAFEQAALASPDKDPAAARMWAAAGNMWLAAGQNGKAAYTLDKALALPGLESEQRGEALLDRARTAEAGNDLKTARARLNEALQTISDDPFAWYFSAALAIREGDQATAQSAINRALALAPDEPLVLFEAGHVAHFIGDGSRARDYWTRVSQADPKGNVGKSARDALTLLDTPAPPSAGPSKP